MKIAAGQCRNLKDVPAPTLKIGPYAVDPPVVLAPMAGITNVAFRQLCRQYGAGLYVCEMITARALVERDAMTMHMITFDEGENPRSMQLYGVDPKNVGEATKMIVDENLADHMDMNFGCPVPKVTRKGGGAALPYKRELFRQIVRSAVRNAGDMPVTVKFRIGIDDEHLTYLDAGRIAQDEGAQAVALHARTASQRYSGKADWDAIARLKEAVTNIPVLGNGDIFSAQDALDMVAKTGCDGVVVGRGCLGRPWLFRRPAGGVSRRADAGRADRSVRSPRCSARTRGCSRPTTVSTRACGTCASTWPGTGTGSRWAATRGERSRWCRACRSWTT